MDCGEEDPHDQGDDPGDAAQRRREQGIVDRAVGRPIEVLFDRGGGGAALEGVQEARQAQPAPRLPVVFRRLSRLSVNLSSIRLLSTGDVAPE